MGNRTLIHALALLSAATIVAAGCSPGNAIPQHSPDEQKAIDQITNMSPQQRIDMIEKGPMPKAAKEAMIKKIKQQSGMQ